MEEEEEEEGGGREDEVVSIKIGCESRSCAKIGDLISGTRVRNTYDGSTKADPETRQNDAREVCPWPVHTLRFIGRCLRFQQRQFTCVRYPNEIATCNNENERRNRGRTETALTIDSQSHTLA